MRFESCATSFFRREDRGLHSLEFALLFPFQFARLLVAVDFDCGMDRRDVE